MFVSSEMSFVGSSIANFRGVVERLKLFQKEQPPSNMVTTVGVSKKCDLKALHYPKVR